jgi:hypothetical protein
MAITQGICYTFKQELLSATHNFSSAGGHTFNMALMTSASTNGPTTDHYSGGTINVSGEIAAGGNYSTGGKAMTKPGSMPGLTTTTAWMDFDDVLWSASTITNARGAMIYNATSANRSVVVLDFGADKSSSAGDFTVVMPAGDSANAIIRIT